MFNECECIYLKPGEIHESDGELVVNTVLGSCVSVTMYVRRLKYGIICHCMLPASNEGNKQSEDCMRYVDCALSYMNDKFINLGVSKKEIEVKLFGGSDMFSTGGAGVTVGARNVAAAIELLNKYNFVLMAQDTGGQFTRKLYFSLDTGTVYLRKISKMQGM